METNKVDDGLPRKTQRDHWREYPGELVMEYVHEHEYDPKTWGLEFAVRKLTSGKHFPPDSPQNKRQREVYYEASTPYRGCVYQGDSPEAALGALLLGVGLLSRDGHFNPEHPTASGSPPVQHAIHILTERLLWQVERRKDHITHANEPRGIPYVESEEWKQALTAVGRDNEIISALATSIAALARVKDL